MTEPVVATRGSLRKLRGYVLGIIVGLVFIVGGIVRVEMAAREVHREAERSEQERCRTTLLAREGSLEKDRRIITGLGERLEATPDEISEFIDNVVIPAYDDLPTPADCE